jgi:hypothetical protein
MPTIKRDPTDDLRLASLDIIKRKIRVAQAMLEGDERVAGVFNASELAVLRRIAAGEQIPSVRLSAQRAREELAWADAGGLYPAEVA